MSKKFEPVKYGKEFKKICFYDSDKRHADLRVRFQYDGLKQSEFFRGVVTAYLEKEENFMKFLEEFKKDSEILHKTKLRKQEKIRKKEKDLKTKFALENKEVESIFDMLEEEHPDL